MSAQYKIERIVNILLIVAVGFIAPVSYFSAYSPHQVVATYRLSVLDSPAHTVKLQRLLQSRVTESLAKRPANLFGTPAAAIGPRLMLTHFNSDLQSFNQNMAFQGEQLSAHLQRCRAAMLAPLTRQLCQPDLRPPLPPPKI